MTSFYTKSKKVIFALIFGIMLLYNVCSWANVVNAASEDGAFSISDFNIFYKDACTNGESVMTGTDGKTYQCVILGSATPANTNYKYGSTSTIVNDATTKKWINTGTENTGRVLYYLSGQDVESVNTGFKYAENTTEFYQSYSIYKYTANWIKTGQLFSTKNNTYYSSSSSSTTGGDDADSLYKYTIDDTSNYYIYYGLKNLNSDYIFTDASDYGFKQTVSDSDTYHYEAITDANGVKISTRDFDEWVLSKTYSTKDVNGKEVADSHNTTSYYDKTANVYWIYDAKSSKFYAYEAPTNTSSVKWTDTIEPTLDGTDGVFAPISQESSEKIVYYWKQWFNYYVTTEKVLTTTTSKNNALIAGSTPSTIYNNDSYTYYTQGDKESTTTNYTFNYSLKVPVYYGADEYAFTSDWYSNVAEAINASDSTQYTSSESDKAETKTQHQYDTVDTYDETYTEKASSITSDNATKSNTSSILYKLTDTKFSYNYYTTQATYGVDTNSYVNVTAKNASDLGLGLCSNVTGSSYLSNYCLVSNSGTATGKSDFRKYKVNYENKTRYLSTTDWTTENKSDTSDRQYVVTSNRTDVSASVRSDLYSWNKTGSTYYYSINSSYFNGNYYYNYTGSSTIKTGDKYTQHFYRITPSTSDSYTEWSTDSNKTYSINGSLLASNPTGTYYKYVSDSLYRKSGYLITYTVSSQQKKSWEYYKTNFNKNYSSWMKDYGFNENCSNNSEGLTKDGDNVSSKAIIDQLIEDYKNTYYEDNPITTATHTYKRNIVYHSDSWNKKNDAQVGNSYSVSWTEYTISIVLTPGYIYWKNANKYDNESLSGTQYYAYDSSTEAFSSGNYYEMENVALEYKYTVTKYTYSSSAKTFTTYNESNCHDINLYNSAWDIPKSYWEYTTVFDLYYDKIHDEIKETRYYFDIYKWESKATYYDISMQKIDNNNPTITNCSNSSYYNSYSNSITFSSISNASTSNYGLVYLDNNASTVPSSFNINETKLQINSVKRTEYTQYKKYDVYEKYTATTNSYVGVESELSDSTYNHKTIAGYYYEKINGTDYYQFTKAHLKQTGETRVGNPQTKFFNQNEINNGATNNKYATTTSNGYQYEKTNTTRYYYDTWNVKHRNVTETYSGDNTWYDNAPQASKKTNKTACSTIGIGTDCFTYKSSAVTARSSRNLYKYKMYHKQDQIKRIDTTTATTNATLKVNGSTNPANKDSIYGNYLPTYKTPCSSSVTYNCYIYNSGASTQNSTSQYYYTANTVSYSNQMINKTLKTSDKYYSMYKNTAGSNSEVETHTYDDVEVVNKLSLYKFVSQSSKSGLNTFYLDNNNHIILNGNNGTMTYRLTGLTPNRTYYLVASTASNITIIVNNASQNMNNTTSKFAFTSDVSGNATITVRVNGSGNATLNWIEVLTNNPSSNTYYAYSESSKIVDQADSGFNTKKSYEHYYLKATKTYYPNGKIKTSRVNSFKTTNGLTNNRTSFSDEQTFLLALIRAYNEDRLVSVSYAIDVNDDGNYHTITTATTSFYNSDKTKLYKINANVRKTLYEQKIKTVSASWNNTTDTYLKSTNYMTFKDLVGKMNLLSSQGDGLLFTENVNGTVYTAPQNSELGKFLMLYRLIYVQRGLTDTNVVFNTNDKTFYVFSNNYTAYHLFNVYRDENKNNNNEKLDSGFTTKATIAEVSTFLSNNSLTGITYNKTDDFNGVYIYTDSNGNVKYLNADKDLTTLVSPDTATPISAAQGDDFYTLILIKDAKNYNNEQIKSGSDTFKLTTKGDMYTLRTEYKPVGVFNDTSDELGIMSSYNDADGNSVGSNFITPSDLLYYAMKYTVDGVEHKVIVLAKSTADAKKWTDAHYNVSNSEIVDKFALSALDVNAIANGAYLYNNYYYDIPYYVQLGTNSNTLYKLQLADNDVNITRYFTLDALKDYYMNDHKKDSEISSQEDLEQTLQYSSTLVNGIDSFKLHFNGMTNITSYSQNFMLDINRKAGMISSRFFGDSDNVEEIPEFILVNTGYKNNISFNFKNYHSTAVSSTKDSLSYHEYSMTADKLASYDVYSLYAIQKNDVTLDYINYIRYLRQSLNFTNQTGDSIPSDYKETVKENKNVRPGLHYDSHFFPLSNEEENTYYNFVQNLPAKLLFHSGGGTVGDYDYHSLKSDECILNSTYFNSFSQYTKNAFTMYIKGDDGLEADQYNIYEMNYNLKDLYAQNKYYIEGTYNKVEKKSYLTPYDFKLSSEYDKIFDQYLKTDQNPGVSSVSKTNYYNTSNTLYYENNITTESELYDLLDVEETMIDAIRASWEKAVNADGSYDYIKVFSSKNDTVYLYRKLANTNFIKNNGNSRVTHVMNNEAIKNYYNSASTQIEKNFMKIENVGNNIDSGNFQMYSLPTEGSIADDTIDGFSNPYLISVTTSINDFVPINYYLKKNNNVMQAVEMSLSDWVENGNIYTSSGGKLSYLMNDATGQIGFTHMLAHPAKNSNLDTAENYDYVAFTSNVRKSLIFPHSNYGSSREGYVSGEISNYYTYKNQSFSNSNLAMFAFYGLELTYKNGRIEVTSELSKDNQLQNIAADSTEPVVGSLTGKNRKVGMFAQTNINNRFLGTLTFGFAFKNTLNNEVHYLNATELIDKYFNNAITTYGNKDALKAQFYADAVYHDNIFYNTSLASLAEWHAHNSSLTYSTTDSEISYTMTNSIKGDLGTITFGTTQNSRMELDAEIVDKNIIDKNYTLGENSFDITLQFNTLTAYSYNEFLMYYIPTTASCAEGYTYSANSNGEGGKCFIVLGNKSLPTPKTQINKYYYSFDVYSTRMETSGGNGLSSVPSFNGGKPSIDGNPGGSLVTTKIDHISNYESSKKLTANELLEIIKAKPKYGLQTNLSISTPIESYGTIASTDIWNTILTRENITMSDYGIKLLPTTRYYIDTRVRDQFGNILHETGSNHQFEFVTGQDMVTNPYYENADIINNIITDTENYYKTAYDNGSVKDLRDKINYTNDLLMKKAIPADLYYAIYTMPSNYVDVLKNADDLSNRKFLVANGYTNEFTKFDSTEIDTENGKITYQYVIYNRFMLHITDANLTAINLKVKSGTLNGDTFEASNSFVDVKDDFIIKDTTSSKILVTGKAKNGSIRIDLNSDKLKAIASSYSTYDDFVYNYLLNYKTNNVTFTSNNTKFDHNKYYLIEYNFVLGEIRYYLDTNLDNSGENDTYLGSLGDELASDDVRGEKLENNHLRKLVYMNDTYYLGYVRDGHAIIIK